MKGDWVNLPAPASLVVGNEKQSYSLSFAPSPYSIPQAFRVRTDPGSGEFVVDFRYIDEGEPTSSVAHAPGVVVCLGSNSKRVFQLRLDKNLVQNKNVRLEIISQELKKLEDAGTPRFRDNYAAANSFVRSQPNLFEEKVAG
jgi:hypothetical protein